MFGKHIRIIRANDGCDFVNQTSECMKQNSIVYLKLEHERIREDRTWENRRGSDAVCHTFITEAHKFPSQSHNFFRYNELYARIVSKSSWDDNGTEILTDLWYAIVWYDIIWSDMVWSDMMRYDMLWYVMIWYHMT